MLRFSSHQVDEVDVKDAEMVEAEPLEESEYISNMIVSEVPVDTFIEETIIEEKEFKEAWLEAPTRLLISLLVKMQPNLGKSFDLKNKNKMLEKIHKALGDEGYNFTLKQVHSKYRTMERRYREVKKKQLKTGRKKKPLLFERELDKLFGEIKVCPDYILESEEYDPATGTVVYTPIPKKARVKGGSESYHKKIVRKLEEIANEKAEFRSNMQQRIAKREEIEQERNELLKRIAAALENNFNVFVQPDESCDEK